MNTIFVTVLLGGGFLISPTGALAEEAPGCAVSPTPLTFGGGGFSLDQYNAMNVATNPDGYLELQTGQEALKQEDLRIVIPFDQQISVTFIYEGAGYKLTDFGWMFAKDGPPGVAHLSNPDPAKHHIIYTDINDNNNDGKLDSGVPATVLLANGANFAAGQELVFFLKVDNASQTYYTRMDWNPDTYQTGVKNECNVTKPFTKRYNLGEPLAGEGQCRLESGWMVQAALDRVQVGLGLDFTGTTKELTIMAGQKYPHALVGAPKNSPRDWILGWEDLKGGGDTDHNDLIFRINRKTGGTTDLKPPHGLKTGSDDTYFTSATIKVIDYMPICQDGNETHTTLIDYEVSANGGANWEPVTEWRLVHPSDRKKKVYEDEDITQSWTYGEPTEGKDNDHYSYRVGTISFRGKGYGNKNNLIWKATLVSDNEECIPEILQVELSGAVARHGFFSRAEPILLANVLYAGNYETPDHDWPQDEQWDRGHLTATMMYYPDNPELDAGTDQGRTPVPFKIWDAGEAISNQNPALRKIYFPDVQQSSDVTGKVMLDGQVLKGDGDTRIFVFTTNEDIRAAYDESKKDVKFFNKPATISGIDADKSIWTGTLELTASTTSHDGVEKLIHDRSNRLKSDEEASQAKGDYNQFTGEIYVLVFDKPVVFGTEITAKYRYYTTSENLLDFSAANLNMNKLGLEDEQVVGRDKKHDFNKDGAVNQSDVEYLVNWIRGFKNGKNIKKTWLLGSIDHSVPAIDAPPPKNPPGYTLLPEDQKIKYDAFYEARKNDPVRIFVGSLDGMLHAINGGSFSWEDNERTSFKENRGHFIWSENGDAVSIEASRYGDGTEAWAFIPHNLLPNLQEKLTGQGDPAWVDASPTTADVFINGQWRSVLTFAQGQGGATIVCLDVTEKDSPKFMWEFNDVDLFNSFSSPSIAKIEKIRFFNQEKWVALFVSGHQDEQHKIIDEYPSIFVIDISNGELLERIYLKDDRISDDILLGDFPSGQPATMDWDNDGYMDRMYIGVESGYMFKVTFPDNGNPETCAINVNEREDGQYIYGSPSLWIEREEEEGGHGGEGGGAAKNVRIFFGTGDSPFPNDDTEVQPANYKFYAYKDEEGINACNSAQQEWSYDLPAGQQVWASAFASAGKIYFGTTNAASEDPCDGFSGEGNENTGELYVFDIEDAAKPETPLQPDDKIAVEGGIQTTPMVMDQHVFIKQTDANVLVLGDGDGNERWNTEVIGFSRNVFDPPQTRVKSWKELY